jgi:hypothetical protein
MDLTATDQSLQVVTSAAGSIDFAASWVDLPASGSAEVESADGNIATATTTTIVAAPASGTDRKVKQLLLRNKSATGVLVTIRKLVGASQRDVYSATLYNNQSLRYSYETGFTLDAGFATTQTNWPLFVAKTGRIVSKFRRKYVAQSEANRLDSIIVSLLE